MRKALSGIIGGALLATAMLAGGAPANAMVVGAGPANASVTGSVGNTFECSLQTGKCVQMNGAYKSYNPTTCIRVWRPILAGNRSSALCDRWV